MPGDSSTSTVAIGLNRDFITRVKEDVTGILEQAIVEAIISYLEKFVLKTVAVRNNSRLQWLVAGFVATKCLVRGERLAAHESHVHNTFWANGEAVTIGEKGSIGLLPSLEWDSDSCHCWRLK
ncbi:hypothetical protein Adt_32262 [Abeliophyllum distichum]|uniref:Uncharacterized protein n=1 Tax=Abeliophyllum distichum TaxID=126358 RepID=A0ABD1QTQ9_9LAMI